MEESVNAKRYLKFENITLYFFGERRWENEEPVKVLPKNDLSLIKFKNANYVELSVLYAERSVNKILHVNSEICSCRTILNT